MIFRNKMGELISIRRNQYISDTEYYRALLDIKQPRVITEKSNNKSDMKHHIAFILQNAKNMH